MYVRLAIIVAALLLWCSPPASAQYSINPDAAADAGDGTQIVVPPHGPAPTDIRPTESAPPTLEVNADACRYAVQHVPSANTDYKPGVDVNGNPVAPADLAPQTPLNFPSAVPILVTSNLARMLGNMAPGATAGTTSSGGNGGYRADALVGVVSLVDGRLYFNGQPIGDDPDAELAALCRNASSARTSGAR